MRAAFVAAKIDRYHTRTCHIPVYERHAAVEIVPPHKLIALDTTLSQALVHVR